MDCIIDKEGFYCLGYDCNKCEYKSNNELENLKKIMTKKEFIEELEKSNYGWEKIDSKYGFSPNCPRDIGLNNLNEPCCCNYIECKKCWLNSINDIKFKD